TTVGEVATGFNVRGGGVDQNLVLYDGVPVFNTSHALGFFTAFNSDAVSQVSFYRGGIPAEYGGRVSSVLSIASKEGPFDKWSGGGGIGAISSYLTVGGPIKKDTTSVIASVRASYSDWVLGAIKSNYRNLANSAMTFYDASLKVTHKFSDRTKLNVSGYTSLDEFSLVNDSIYASRNITASAQLNHAFSEKLFSLISLNFGRYGYTVREEDPANAFNLAYHITYPSLKIDFNYDGEHKLYFGLHNTLYDFNPGSLKPTHAESAARTIGLPNERSLESALYGGGSFNLSENVLIEAGLRTSLFRRFGPGILYAYASDKPRETGNIVDSTEFSSGENMKTYYGIEPRLSVRYSLSDNASLKLGYNRMFQYIHLVTNTAAVTPVDIWQSGNAYFKPQVADQISVGYYRNLKEDTYEAYTEVFYKHVSNVLDFRDGANLILNRHLETALLPGNSRAYGIEVSVNKVRGRLIGTLNYTFSRSWRRVDGTFQQDKINDGDPYPAHYDQPHVATLNWRYGISRRHFFTGSFTYRTGRPMSLPLSGYKVDGVPVVDFSERNLYRMPDYHRLDIAFVIEGNHKRKKLLDGTWVISFYNAYGRKNAYSVFFKDDGRGYITPYKLSVVGSIIPSVSYSFKF
ncbi:MAG TPA: TonB-dependent receptor, partial [Ohtaekwangia sp.]|nr:TonB-dependent receptor [Ohtaekwangia sp.]